MSRAGRSATAQNLRAPLVTMPNVLKVAAQSKPTAVAGAIAGLLRTEGHAEIQAIGAGAVNQAIKAVAVCRSYLAPQRLDLVCIPAFTEVEIDAGQRTAVRLVIQRWDYDEVRRLTGDAAELPQSAPHDPEMRPE